MTDLDALNRKRTLYSSRHGDLLRNLIPVMVLRKCEEVSYFDFSGKTLPPAFGMRRRSRGPVTDPSPWRIAGNLPVALQIPKACEVAFYSSQNGEVRGKTCYRSCNDEGPRSLDVVDR